MNSVRVLVVEDDAFDAEVVSRSLTKSQHVEYEVDHVYTLSNAFKRVFTVPYDIVLLDLGLPDGSELHGLSRLVSLLDIPIVVLTGNDDPQLAERALDCGAHDYIPKSENLGVVLHRTVQFSIQRHRTQKALARTEEMLSVQSEFSKIQSAKIREKLTKATRLAAFARATGDCVAILSHDCEIEWANEAFEAYCNADSGQLENLSLFESLSVFDEVEWLEEVRQSARNGEHFRRCWTVEQDDETLRCCRVELTPLPQQTGSIRRFAFSMADDRVASLHQPRKESGQPQYA